MPDAAPDNPAFLQSDVTPSPPADARFHVIPCPLEQTVSYGAGTRLGPAAILEASQHLETYDGISVPAEAGIHTTAPIPCLAHIQDVFEHLAARTAAAQRVGAVPVVLGGEHSLTLGAVRGLMGGSRLGVIQFDAHADLRDTYDGTPHSHACVMRRVLELDIPIFQIGVRSLTKAEHELRRVFNIAHLDAANIARGQTFNPFVPMAFPKHVYVTFDVDALDPSIMPATGTPEPGGLTWYGVMEMLAAIVRERTVIGFDVVELAPTRGQHAAEFTAARLIYNLMGMITRK